MHLFKRGLSLGMALIFGVIQPGLAPAAEAQFWEDRRRGWSHRSPAVGWPEVFPVPLSEQGRVLPASPLDVPGISPAQKKILEALSMVPGTVREVRPGRGPWVIHFQDVHQNPEAQGRLAQSLQALVDKELVRGVGLEGVFGPVHLEPFRQFPQREVTARVAGYLRKTGKITGPVEAALTSPEAFPPLVGVDDRTLYRDNVAAVLRAERARPSVESALQAESRRLAAEGDLFSPALRELDQAAADYQDGRIGLVAYIGVLLRGRRAGTPQLDRFSRAMALERTLDFDAVERERRGVLSSVNSFAGPEIQELLLLGKAYRAGLRSGSAFYGRLRDLCRTRGVDLGKYPSFGRYMDYLRAAEAIRGEELFSEILVLENRVYGALARNPREKAWGDRSQWVRRAQKLVRFELTPEEWRAFRAGPSGFLDLGVFEAFYQKAEARDGALAEGVRKIFGKTRPGTSEGPRAVVLVAGGFHGPGVKEKLRQAGYGWVSFSPKMENWEGPRGVEALSVFSQRQTPLGKLFAGEKLYLTPDPLAGIPQASVLIPGLSDSNTQKIQRYLAQVAPSLVGKISVERTDLSDHRVRLRVFRDGRAPLDVFVRRGENGDIQSVEEKVPEKRSWALWRRVLSWIPYSPERAPVWEEGLFRTMLREGDPFLVWLLARHVHQSLEGVLVSLLGLVGQQSARENSPGSGLRAHALFNRVFPAFSLSLRRDLPPNPILREAWQLEPWWDVLPGVRLQFTHHFLTTVPTNQDELQEIMNLLRVLVNNLRTEEGLAAMAMKGTAKGLYRVKTITNARLYFSYDARDKLVTMIAWAQKGDTVKREGPNKVMNPDFIKLLKSKMKDSLLDHEATGTLGLRLHLFQEEDEELIQEFLVNSKSILPRVQGAIKNIDGLLSDESANSTLLLKRLISLYEATQGDAREIKRRLTAGVPLSAADWKSLEFVDPWAKAWKDFLENLAIQSLPFEKVSRLYSHFPFPSLGRSLGQAYFQWAKKFLTDVSGDPEILSEALSTVRAEYEALLKGDEKAFRDESLEELLNTSMDIESQDLSPIQFEGKENNLWRSGGLSQSPAINPFLSGDFFKTPGEVLQTLSVEQVFPQVTYRWNLLLAGDRGKNVWEESRLILESLIQRAKSDFQNKLPSDWSLQRWLDIKNNPDAAADSTSELQRMNKALQTIRRQAVFVPVGPDGKLAAHLAYLSHRYQLPFWVVGVESPEGMFSSFLMKPSKEVPKEFKHSVRLFRSSGWGIVKEVPKREEIAPILKSKNLEWEGLPPAVLSPVLDRSVRTKLKEFQGGGVFVVHGLQRKVDSPAPESVPVGATPSTPLPEIQTVPLDVDLTLSLYDQLTHYFNSWLEKNGAATQVDRAWAKKELLSRLRDPKTGLSNKKKASWGKGFVVEGYSSEAASAFAQAAYEAVDAFVSSTRERISQNIRAMKVFEFKNSFSSRVKDLSTEPFNFSFHTEGLLSLGEGLDCLKKVPAQSQSDLFLILFYDFFFGVAEKFIFGVLDEEGVFRRVRLSSMTFPDPQGQTRDILLQAPSTYQDVDIVTVLNGGKGFVSPNNLVFERWPSTGRPDEKTDIDLAPLSQALLGPSDRGGQIEKIENLIRRLDLKVNTSVLNLGIRWVLPLGWAGTRMYVLISSQEFAEIKPWFEKANQEVKSSNPYGLFVLEREQYSDIADLRDFGVFDRVLVNNRAELPYVAELVSSGGKIELSGDAAQLTQDEMDDLIFGLQKRGLDVERLAPEFQPDGHPEVWVLHLGKENPETRASAQRRFEVETEVLPALDLSRSPWVQLGDWLNLNEKQVFSLMHAYWAVEHWNTGFDEKERWVRDVLSYTTPPLALARRQSLDLYTVLASFDRRFRREALGHFQRSLLLERYRPLEGEMGPSVPFYSIQKALHVIRRLVPEQRRATFEKVFRQGLPYLLEKGRVSQFIVGALTPQGYFPYHSALRLFRAMGRYGFSLDPIDPDSLRGALFLTASPVLEDFDDPRRLAVENFELGGAVVSGKKSSVLTKGDHLKIVEAMGALGPDAPPLDDPKKMNLILKSGNRLIEVLDFRPGHSILSLGNIWGALMATVGGRVIYVEGKKASSALDLWMNTFHDLFSMNSGSMTHLVYEPEEDISALSLLGPFDRVLVNKVEHLDHLPEFIQSGSWIFVGGEAKNALPEIDRLKERLEGKGFRVELSKAPNRAYLILKTSPNPVPPERHTLATAAALAVLSGIFFLGHSAPLQAAAGAAVSTGTGIWGPLGMVVGALLLWRFLKKYFSKEFSAEQGHRDGASMLDIVLQGQGEGLEKNLERPGPVLDGLDPRAGRDPAGETRRRSGLLDRVGRGADRPRYLDSLRRVLLKNRALSPGMVFAALAAWRTGQKIPSPSTPAAHLHFAWESDPERTVAGLRRWGAASGNLESVRLALVADTVGKREALRAHLRAVPWGARVDVFDAVVSPESTDGSALYGEFETRWRGAAPAVTVTFGNGQGFRGAAPLRGIPEHSPLYQALSAPLRWTLRETLDLLEIARRVAVFA